MKLTVLESPFAAPTDEQVRVHVDYAKRAMWDMLWRREAPIASRLLYTQVLNDREPAERALGIRAGLAWGEAATRVVFYCNHGVSPGMLQGYRAARKRGQEVLWRAWFDPDKPAQNFDVVEGATGWEARAPEGWVNIADDPDTAVRLMMKRST